MKNQKKTEFKVGLTVIVSIIILLWVLGWAKNFSFNSNEKSLKIAFSNVAGLLIGDVVAVQGIKEGNVTNISNQNNTIIVDVLLSENINLKEDARFSIMMIDLMGGKKIEIYPGISETGIDFTKVQKGEFLGDISTTMATLGSVQDDLIIVIHEIKETLTSFNKIINNSEFIDDLHASVSSLNKLISKTDKLLTENSKTISDLINNSNKLVSNSNDFIEDNKGEIKSSLSNVSQVLKNTDKLIQRIDSFFEEVQKKENNLGKVLYDEDFVKDLSTTMQSLKDLSELIKKQLNEKGIKVDAYIF